MHQLVNDVIITDCLTGQPLCRPPPVLFLSATGVHLLSPLQQATGMYGK